MVVLTDGESNEGSDMQSFSAWYNTNQIAQHDMRIFAIAFGDSRLDQLNNLMVLSKGKVFDGKASLSKAFREISSYQ